MKNFVVIAIILTSCGGGLTEEQRKRIKDEMATSKIQRVSDAEISEAAYSRGRKIVNIFLSDNHEQVDSVLTSDGQSVAFLKRDAVSRRSLENEIMQAYIASEGSTDLQDNIQPIRADDGTADSILYTYPIVETTNDQKVFRGMWSIRMSRKQLILSMNQKD